MGAGKILSILGGIIALVAHYSSLFILLI